MADLLSKKERSNLMSKVNSANTKPEWVLRCALHRLGFRYRLNNKNLSGSPDLVFPKYRTAIFVHGCFWHCHHGCKDASIPKTNREFWINKLSDNVERDKRAVSSLESSGWKVITVWECELTRHTIDTILRVANELNPTLYSINNEAVYTLEIDRKEILELAERRVRYRIDKNR